MFSQGNVQRDKVQDELEKYLSGPLVNPKNLTGGALGWFKVI